MIEQPPRLRTINTNERFDGAAAKFPVCSQGPNHNGQGTNSVVIENAVGWC
jgi:hypothetical protein